MSDIQPVASPNLNKTYAAVGGGTGGIGVGAAVLALLQYKYGIDLGPVLSGVVAGFITTAAATVVAWFVPILTAAQHRAIRALDGSASDDQKTIETISKAQAIVAAAGKSP
jgi:hypothetical protein